MLISWLSASVAAPLKVFHGLCVVAVFQFDAQPTTTHEYGLIGHRTDTSEWVKHDVAGIRPQVDAPLDYIQLQRADMLFVLFIAGTFALQGVRLPHIHPDGRGVFLPNIHRERIMVVGGIGSGFSPGLRNVTT